MSSQRLVLRLKTDQAPRSITSSLAILWLSGLVLAILCQAATALAKGSCLTDPTCKELIERGRSQSKAEKFDTALAAYQDAYAQWPEPWLLVNIGRMQQKLGLLPDARDSFRRYLDEPEKFQDEKTRLRANEYLEQVEDEISKQKAAPKVERKMPAKDLADTKPIDVTRPKPTPVYKTWWFWTAVGAVAAGAVIGASLGAYSKEPGIDGTPVIQPFAK